ncbi:metal ABC transporter solute-binding protein, Zn/Mn family [Shouchella clausii]|uniref:metal ABC transporter solute-binding protein, Zn/Mn family n=1 Tax=Shouchella clausii TaxID=79880 RepID=UPI000BA70996|nr:zinc ABC transporter substrate-binding protein [Shouchella clausii]PAD90960.1 Mn2+/Zn2+ ABC transporter substrate-binding protein [Shouchella clausii]
MKGNRFATILFSSLVCTTLIGCSQNEEENTASEKLSVVTSFYPMYEFAQQVAGDRADVSLMVSAGEDAHHYEPSAQDVAAVNEAEVFVYSSEEMEHWVSSLLNTVENDDLVIARTADGVDLVDTSGSGHAHNHDQHGDEEKQEAAGTINIQGVADHYHTGNMIELTAELDAEVDYDHWHWYTRENADDEWVTVPNQGGPEFNYEALGESFEVRAVLFDENHNEYAESDPIEIVIDDHDHGHGQEEEHEHDEEHGQHHEHGSDSAIEIVGLADHYHTGDVVTLVAQLEEEVDYDHWHWYTRMSEDDEWEAVSGQGTDHFEYKTTGESFEVRAVLFDDDHNTYAESEPVSVIIDDHESHDPHIWLDPVLAQEQVNVIRDALIEADPDGQAIYEENAEAFNKELQALHEDFQAALEDAESRVFVVQHQAFGYLAQRYQLEQVAIGGLSTEVEPSPSRIAEIGKLVEEHNVPVIYYQQGANSAIAETVATETGTETAVLYDLEVLSEELQAEDLGYVDAMRQNLEALQLSIQ